jgi:hypothetical protein
MFSFVLALALAADPKAAHVERNPLYKDLLDPGLVVGPDLRARLPAPTMADGLTPAEQTAVIKKLIAADYEVEEFTRKSVVAPQLLKVRNVTPSDPKAPARGIDVWFVGYGNFDATEDEKFVDRAVNAGRETSDGKGRELTREELGKRKIVLTAEDEKRERIATFSGDFLEKVRIQGIGRAVWSKNAESVVVAGVIDPRFANDADFPNRWRSIIKADGEVKIGNPQPYGGAGFYLKITKLAEPAGAMFFEQHVVFAEPEGWFDGAPLLRAKLPIAVQTTVRAMRREWLKTAK